MAIEELIAIAERSASCEVNGLLKRQDQPLHFLPARATR